MLTRATYRRVKAPGPPALPFLLNVAQFRKDPLAGFFQATLQYGDIVRYRGFWITHQLTNPSQIQHVLQTNFPNYRKGRDYKILRSSLGEGLLTSENPLWQKQRKMTQPAFHSQRIAAAIRIMDAHTQTMLQRWDGPVSRKEVFDLIPDLMHLTLNIVSQALFTTSLESDTEAIGRTLHIGRDYSVNQAWSIIRLPHTFPSERNRLYREALAGFHRIIDRMIADRRRSPDGADDLLAMLMEARDDNGDPMSDKQLRDELATLLTAGHETTTLTLSWACFLIAQHPEVQEQVRAEIEMLNGKAPGFDEIAKLRYTRMVLEETMRLYPPVWVLSRAAVQDDEIDGYYIPADSEILIFPYITHRHPGWWDRPEEFVPERFSSTNTVSRQRYAYLPFGGGPRTCIGLSFAMTEVLVVLTLILQRFRLRLPDQARSVQMDPSVTLRPIPGVFLELSRA